LVIANGSQQHVPSACACGEVERWQTIDEMQYQRAHRLRRTKGNYLPLPKYIYTLREQVKHANIGSYTGIEI